MATRYLLKVQRHAPDPAMAPYQPAGMDAFYAEAVDKDMDDHAYIGFYGPTTLFDNLDQLPAQERLCEWLTKGLLEDEDQTAAELVLAVLIGNAANDFQVKAEVALKDGRGVWTSFGWPLTLSLATIQSEQNPAFAEQRAIELEHKLPGAPSSARNKPKL